MAIVFSGRFVEGTSTDEVTPLLQSAYAEILALDTGAILETQYKLVVILNKKYYSILILYSYNYTEPPPEE